MGVTRLLPPKFHDDSESPGGWSSSHRGERKAGPWPERGADRPIIALRADGYLVGVLIGRGEVGDMRAGLSNA